MELILYGSGRRCEILISLSKSTNVSIGGVVDSDPQKLGKKVGGYRVDSPKKLKQLTDKYICVTFYSSFVVDPIWSDLVKIGFDQKRILSFHDVLLMEYQDLVAEMYVEPIRSRKQKIIFDGAWPLALGGVESWLRQIVPAMIESGVDNTYLITEKTFCKIDNIIDFCLYDTPNFSIEYINKCGKVILEQLPCTVVFSRVDELMLAAALIKDKYPNDIRIIMADHGSCDGMYRDILSYKEYIDYYVCVSSGIKESLIQYGIEPEKVEVMTCPVAYEEAIDRDYSLDADKAIRIGYAGRLEIFEKRIDILKKVIVCLEKKKVDYVLDIAGTGSQFDNLKKFREENCLEDKINLLGQLSHEMMADFWKKHDIALNTSDNEGRPLSNMEAMVNGAVPIVTHTIGILDDVHDNVNGFIVPLEDAELMADRIAYLSENRDLLRQFGEAARNEMIEKINPIHHVAQWKRILEKVG